MASASDNRSGFESGVLLVAVPQKKKMPGTVREDRSPRTSLFFSGREKKKRKRKEKEKRKEICPARIRFRENTHTIHDKVCCRGSVKLSTSKNLFISLFFFFFFPFPFPFPFFLSNTKKKKKALRASGLNVVGRYRILAPSK